jgi:acylglycerol lipase
MLQPTIQNIDCKDHLKLHLKNWSSPQAQAALLIVHGMGEHSARYQHVAEYFVQADYQVWAYDQRGHGMSEGQRGHVPHADQLHKDLESVIDYVRAHSPNLPLVLYGHSMGGNVALSYALKRPFPGVALVLTGPWIQLAFAPPAWKISAAKWLNALSPSLSLANELDTNMLSRDTAVVAAYNSDPLVHDRISARMGYSLMQTANWLNTWEGTVPVPTLIMHGSEDGLTSFAASKAFAARVKGNISFKDWPGLYHEIHNEPEKQAVLDHVFHWLATKW